MKKDDELVYGFDAKYLVGIYEMMFEKTGCIRGASYSAMISSYYNKFLDNSYFQRRGDVESNPHFKQWVSYAYFRDENDQIFSYERSGAEKRLNAAISIGIGGHVNPDDLPKSDEDPRILDKATIREIYEELNLPDSFDYHDDVILSPNYSLLYSEENEVSKVHFGFVTQIDVDSSEKDEYSIKSEGRNGRWRSVEDLLSDPKLEGWSRNLLKAIYK